MCSRMAPLAPSQPASPVANTTRSTGFRGFAGLTRVTFRAPRASVTDCRFASKTPGFDTGGPAQDTDTAKVRTRNATRRGGFIPNIVAVFRPSATIPGMATLLLFFDGVGIGNDEPETNPFAEAGARRLSVVAGRAPDPEAAYRPLDATLGVAGLPQSATGQTTIY